MRRKRQLYDVYRFKPDYMYLGTIDNKSRVAYVDEPNHPTTCNTLQWVINQECNRGRKRPKLHLWEQGISKKSKKLYLPLPEV